VSDFTPTPEQAEAIRLFGTGRSLAIEAGAGTGKTSTLVLLAHSTTRRGRYIAFNKAIVEESKSKFPANVDCSTAHSLAYRSVIPGTRFAERLRNSRRMKSTEIADRLGLDEIVVELPGGERKRLARTYLAGLAMRGVTRFCQSADREPTERHVPYVDGIDIPPVENGRRNRRNNDLVARSLVSAMRRAWADLSDEDGALPFKHDHYLKMWHLSGPRIDGDFILFDEAQDANPVLVDIVRQQRAQIVWVGDSQQSIYGFTGAVNALATVGADERTFLTQSFRFGPAVAEVANRVLTDLDAELRVVGHAPILSRVEAVASPDAILCRTNAMAVRNFLDSLDAGLRPHLVGGGREVVDFAKGALDLMERGWTSHPELACFGSWGEVETYVEQDEQGGDLQLLVKLIGEFGAQTIIDALERMPREADADLVISTAHKSKGREWTSVRLAADFPPAPAAEELRLLYVAVTRAKVTLDISAVGYFELLDEIEETVEAEIDHDSPDHDHAACVECNEEAREADRRADDETSGAAPAAPRIVEQIATGSGPTREQIEQEMIEARETLAARAVADWHVGPFEIHLRDAHSGEPLRPIRRQDGGLAVAHAKAAYATGRYASATVVDSRGELVIEMDS
jgi:hypothetical protein